MEDLGVRKPLEGRRKHGKINGPAVRTSITEVTTCSIKQMKVLKVGTPGDLAQEDSALPMHLHGAGIWQSFSKHEKNGKGPTQSDSLTMLLSHLPLTRTLQCRFHGLPESPAPQAISI